MCGSLAKCPERAKSFVTLELSGSKLDSHDCILPSTVMRIGGNWKTMGMLGLAAEATARDYARESKKRLSVKIQPSRGQFLTERPTWISMSG